MSRCLTPKAVPVLSLRLVSPVSYIRKLRIHHGSQDTY
jgi:hypothetical protein